ncbi:MAG: protein translocase subunit SecD [Candidatus Melainabacteria bacterium]|nr:protein translocase subunit SecD [Candidatus Melainabacteria bacterium]
MLKNPKVLLIIVLALLVGAVFTIVKKEPRLGLDLKGGIRLTLEAVATTDVPEITPQVMDSLHFIIEKRVNGLGISESIVQRTGEKRLIVEVPGIQNPEEAKRMLGKVGKLEFKKREGANWVATGLSGKDLKSARLGTLQNGQWIIEFELNGQGAQRFGELTTQLAPQQEALGIFFDEKLVSAPAVRTPILQGSGYIEGQFTRQEAKEQVDLLNAGALPVNVNVIEETTVGPLLGLASIQQSLMAGLIGLALVLVFMVINYRLQGLVADMALVVYTLLTYALFVLFGVTFTLAGIAGFILSIGMAVDANILIFERTKEEILGGRSVLKAIEVGFERAFPSIFDSNMTTLITCSLLWFLGTGAVKGFALTLAIGVAVSMFSAITVTRTFLQILLGQGGQSVNPALFGLKANQIKAAASS